MTSEHDHEAESHSDSERDANEPVIFVASSQKLSADSSKQKSLNEHRNESSGSSEDEFNNLDHNDVNERSVTSSQYNSNSVVNQVQDGS